MRHQTTVDFRHDSRPDQPPGRRLSHPFAVTGGGGPAGESGPPPFSGQPDGGQDGTSGPTTNRGQVRKSRPPKLYRIGEVVEYSGLSRQTIHNYTAMGLIHESRWTNGGHRLYDEMVFERLDQVAQLKMQGRSMEYIRQYFVRLDAS